MRNVPSSRIFSFFTLLVFLISISVAGSVHARDTCLDPSTEQRWAVILSPGPEDGVPWGGYHVTLAGYSNMHACNCDKCGLCESPQCCCDDKETLLRGAFKAFFKNTPWHLHGDLPRLQNWSGTWTQPFESAALNRLANYLDQEGFEKIKGPEHPDESGRMTPWHITLSEDKTRSAAKVAAFKRNQTDWYLWLVPSPPQECIRAGTNCPTWHRIERL